MNIFVVNGCGGSGKTSFEKMICNICKKENKKATILSTIDGVKEIARKFGWDEGKELKDRKMLSDLKELLTKYNDYPYRDTLRRLNKAEEENCDVVFIDSREPADIERWCKEVGSLSILVDRGLKIIYNNYADDNVDDYSYDIYVSNKDDLKALEEQARIFYETFICEEGEEENANQERNSTN